MYYSVLMSPTLKSGHISPSELAECMNFTEIDRFPEKGSWILSKLCVFYLQKTAIMYSKSFEYPLIATVTTSPLRACIHNCYHSLEHVCWHTEMDGNMIVLKAVVWGWVFWPTSASSVNPHASVDWLAVCVRQQIPSAQSDPPDVLCNC